MIDFPANPTVGQQFTAAGVTWTFDGVKWAASGLSIAYVPLAGFVPAMNDNRLINGDMRVNQRGVSSGTAFGYTLDRWFYNGTQAAKGTWTCATSNVPPISYYLFFTSSSAYTPLAGDTFSFLQAIEADMISDFAWGTANAQPVTLSFLVASSLTGTFSGAIGNYANTRSYPFTYSVSTANTWTKIAVTIPGDTTGTWVMRGNGGAAMVFFELGGGATYRAPAGAWANGNFSGANGAVSVVATNGATFQVTGVKLEIGSVATPFNRQSLAKTMADCQRYYCANIPVHAVATAAGASNYLGAGGCFPVQMRATPTVAFQSQIQAPSNVGAATIDAITTAGFRTYAQSAAAGTMAFDNNYTASAEL